MNDTTHWKASLRDILRRCVGQRLVDRVLLVGTVALFATGGDRLEAQLMRTNRTSSTQPVPVDEPPLIPPSTPTDEVFEEPGYGDSYGWGGESRAADCGFGCPPTLRVRAEVLELNREGDSGVILSNQIRLGDFDYTEGGRITIDRKLDCSLGWELVYMGVFEWEEAGQAAAAGTLTTTIAADPGVNLSAFNNANLHQHTYRSRLQSIEVLQKWWGWDVFTCSSGMRFLDIQEDVSFRSVDAGNNEGILSIKTDNYMIGPQLGFEMLYPIGRWSFDNSFKGALFANIGDSSVFVSNAGAVQVANTAEDVEFAAMVEYGTYVRFSLSPRVSVRAGYELVWIYGLGLAVEQVRGSVNPTSGRNFDGKGDLFYHGGTLGVEVVF
jgi:hypothetical protein